MTCPIKFLIYLAIHEFLFSSILEKKNDKDFGKYHSDWNIFMLKKKTKKEKRYKIKMFQ